VSESNGHRPAPDPGRRHVRVAIAGAGFSGLGMAMALKQDGIEDFLVLERADDLGGTWRDNTYPGCACDIPSVLYCWSEDQSPSWTRAFASHSEIWQYMRDVVARHALLPHLRFGHEVLSMRWDEHRACWELETTGGTFTAEAVVSAVGGLSEPAVPRLPGIERFGGKTFHSARWDHEHDLRGCDVAVVGTGASAIQFVPEIQPHVRRLHLFQRTPPWVMPRENAEIAPRWRQRFARHPPLLRLVRWVVFSLHETLHLAFTHPSLMAVLERRARRHIAEQVPDPALREKLTPNYRLGCKRILGSNTWYPALCADNVEVVTSGIREVTPTGIVDHDGREHRVDTIIFGTGFHVTDPPVAATVTGREGKTLAETWQGSMNAHLGLGIAGFPNFFMLLGPNTGLGHNSVVLMAEAQIAYIRQALAHMRRNHLATIEPTPEAQSKFVMQIDCDTTGSVWTAGGCVSWYLDSTGRNSTLWPGSVRAYQRRLARFQPSEHRFTLPRPTRERELTPAMSAAD